MNPLPETPAKTGPPQRSKLHWWLLGCFYVLAVVWGIRCAYYPAASVLEILVPLAMCTVMCIWAVADSIARSHPIPLLARFWFFILAGIVVPGYIVWSRGWRGVGKLLMHSIAWYGICLAGMFAMRTVLYGWA
ncbi:hypothetical protein Psta_0427 [Pirellula staleyi DSM 6068]|uniref:Transmembrane protein n=1 Tax=Pirellula staleyi (strain ATCC 27377 / DSM 6068 / ICPB 4128) TaxID=530564 RepID=D2R386_PIRSD|nr:hypothetical protein [Pirellula staleyi]ADB15117.1 hypothetical protein Psta_0427 [Pirellula staleyi DSM 6068]